MPYIKEQDRAYAPERSANCWISEGSSAPGELNFKISTLIEGYFRIYGFDYQRINDVVGALECCKLEVYRRMAAPYENKKCADNGDVFFHFRRKVNE
jgi:hypothetical protein